MTAENVDKVERDILFGELRSFLAQGSLIQYPHWLREHTDILPSLEDYYRKHVPYLKTLDQWREGTLSAPDEFRELDFYLAPWYTSLNLKDLWLWDMLFQSEYRDTALAWKDVRINIQSPDWDYTRSLSYEQSQNTIRAALKTGLARLAALDQTFPTSCDTKGLSQLMRMGIRYSRHLVITDLHLRYTHDLLGLEEGYQSVSWHGLQRVYVESSYDLIERRLLEQLAGVGVLSYAFQHELPDLIFKCYSFEQALRLIGELQRSLDRSHWGIFFKRLTINLQIARDKTHKTFDLTFDYVKGEQDFFDHCQRRINTAYHTFLSHKSTSPQD